MIRGVPYDAEVEYIETTGNDCWFDTGLTGEGGLRFLGDIIYTKIEQVSASGSLFGWVSSAGDRQFLNIAYTSLNWQIGWGPNTNYRVDGSVFINVRYKIDCSVSSGDQHLIVNGASIYSSQHVIQRSLYLPVLVNRLSYNGSGNVNGLYATGGAYAKYYGIKFYDASDNLLRDFIPVRFTNEHGQSEGAMYDRVTKKLFRNQGTGSFVIGPDVAKPIIGLHFMKPRYTAKDYVQDGLVAMWDGIENAGWRQHDPNAMVWKDLIGTRDAMVASFAHFTSNALTCHSRDAQQIESMATTGSGTYLPEPMNSQAYTIEICLITDSDYFNLTGQYNCYNIFSPGHSNPKGYTSRWGLWGTSWLGGLWLSGGDNIKFIYTRDNLATNTGPKTFSVSYSANFSGAGRYCSSGNGYYVNGKQNTYNGLGNYSARITSSGISIGGNGTEGGINGEIYNVRIYDKMLTANEIAANYEIDKARFNLLEVAS